MKKTKTFTQYTNDCLNISLKIGISGKIRKKSIIIYKGNISRKWYKDNKEYKKEYDKKYYKNNKEYCNKRNKEWIINNHSKVLIYNKRSRAKRRGFGYDPINEPFEDSHFHHLHINNDKNIGIHIPAELHRSVNHKNYNKPSMDKINNLAFKWLKNNKD